MVTRTHGGLVGLLVTLALAGCGAQVAASSRAAFRHVALPDHQEARVQQRHAQPLLHSRPRRTPPPLPLAPAHGTLPCWLHTASTTIVDAHNRPVRLAAVNWSGADLTDFV